MGRFLPWHLVLLTLWLTSCGSPEGTTSPEKAEVDVTSVLGREPIDFVSREGFVRWTGDSAWIRSRWNGPGPFFFGIAVGAVPHLAEQLMSLENLNVCGLMAMAPLTGEEDRVDWTFARTQEIFEDMLKERSLQPYFRHLSMGMSQDFERAIERGSTMVRIGSALFEGMQLNQPDEPD